MPVGLQLIGNYFDEGALLHAAHAFQQATDWHHARRRRGADRHDRSPPLIRGYEVVIGLETHAQLSTREQDLQRRVARRSAPRRTRRPAPVDLALPGTLPVLNRGAVERAIRFGLAVGATIAPLSIFARKNYFYPDLPKGYQISQYEMPVVQGGTRRRSCVGEAQQDRAPDARPPRGRRRQVAARGLSRPDRHRPEPRRHAAAGDRDRARHALAAPRPWTTRRRCTRWWCGSASATATCRKAASAATPTCRCARPGAPLGTRREIKNLNSFRFMQQAIDFEVQWQIDRIEDGLARSSRRPCCSTPTAARRARCAARKTRTTTATSPTPTCRRW